MYSPLKKVIQLSTQHQYFYKVSKRLYSTTTTTIEKERNLIILSQDWTRPKDPPLSLGHASILTNLIANNINAIQESWAVNKPDFSPTHIFNFIMKQLEKMTVSQMVQTDIALGAFVWNEYSVKEIMSKLKQIKFPGRIILGGPQVSYLKKDIEQFYPEVDVFIRGYAESALIDVVRGTSTKSSPTKGVHYAGQPDQGLSSSIELDTLPSPFLGKPFGLIKPQRFIRWETQRGCPFRCAFCQHRESEEASLKRRQFSLARVLQEAEWITENPIIQDVAVLDPIFNSGPLYLQILDQLIKGKYSGKLALQCRLEMVKPEFLDKICKLNETGEVVLEFGLQTIHQLEQKIIDRPNNMQRVKEILNQVYQRRIKSEISLIFGLPHQTVDSFQQSIDFCRQHKVGVIHAFPLMLLRGTPLYHKKEQLGLVESNEIASLAIDRVQTDIPHVVTSSSFTYEDWKRMAKISESLEKENSISMFI